MVLVAAPLAREETLLAHVEVEALQTPVSKLIKVYILSEKIYYLSLGFTLFFTKSYKAVSGLDLNKTTTDKITTPSFLYLEK